MTRRKQSASGSYMHTAGVPYSRAGQIKLPNSIAEYMAEIKLLEHSFLSHTPLVA
jgi:hypothetical protein